MTDDQTSPGGQADEPGDASDPASQAAALGKHAEFLAAAAAMNLGAQQELDELFAAGKIQEAADVLRRTADQVHTASAQIAQVIKGLAELATAERYIAVHHLYTQSAILRRLRELAPTADAVELHTIAQTYLTLPAPADNDLLNLDWSVIDPPPEVGRLSGE